MDCACDNALTLGFALCTQMAYNENQQRVCVEFCKSAGTIGQGRTIRLNHGPQQVPPQLYGRIDGVRLGLFYTCFGFPPFKSQTCQV